MQIVQGIGTDQCMLSNPPYECTLYLVICVHTGNVATEDLVYLLNGFGIAHGIDMEKLLDASAFISTALGRVPHSRVARALLARRQQEIPAAAAA